MDSIHPNDDVCYVARADGRSVFTGTCQDLCTLERQWDEYLTAVTFRWLFQMETYRLSCYDYFTDCIAGMAADHLLAMEIVAKDFMRSGLIDGAYCGEVNCTAMAEDAIREFDLDASTDTPVWAWAFELSQWWDSLGVQS